MMLELSLNQMKAVQGEALRTPCAVRSEPLSRNPLRAHAPPPGVPRDP